MMTTDWRRVTKMTDPITHTLAGERRLTKKTPMTVHPGQVLDSLGKQISHQRNIWHFYHVACCGNDTMAYHVPY